jgi:ATP-dependent protease Clp ATPase subunit
MFDLPSRPDIEECIITAATVKAKQPPEYVPKRLQRKAQ